MQSINSAAESVLNQIAKEEIEPLKSVVDSKVGMNNADKSKEGSQESVFDVNNGQKSASLLEEVKQNLEKVNQFIPIQSINLIFEFDEMGEPPVIKVVDKESSEVIREIPPKEFTEMAKALDEFADKLNGSAMIFDTKV
jgi:flagellar protein FlaG